MKRVARMIWRKRIEWLASGSIFPTKVTEVALGFVAI